MPRIKLEGTIQKINETQTFESGFYKRVAVVMTDEDTKYPQPIPVEFFKEKADKLDLFQIGDVVAIDAELAGNEYNGKNYTNVKGWKIERVGSATENPTEPVPDAAKAESVDDDNLPF